ncbi:hypothetical protein [Marinobacter sp. X15-166B]|uniref:hypothetical protein n=1 Tax=Marinobacter sp. X15-166B TaxID=1897620 RepID=UPI00085C0BA8|nr:hypothetical protein [Marinobacter sp. X15-166B]OEY67455.1 hypothetical protein BG841_14115 [Marinobacter sp. X15-166B]
MYGYPKIIKTRADVEYLAGYMGSKWATEENVQRGLAFLRGLRDNTSRYVFDRTLAENEQPSGNEPQYRVLTTDDGAREQFVLEDNPTARIHQLGFTQAEVQQLIDTIEGAR